MSASTLDIKWRNGLQLFNRPYRHLTPAYVFHRLKHAQYRRRNPTHPDITEAAIAILDKILRPSDVGAEWGAGNSTGWLASRTGHLTSFEGSSDYAQVVRQNLKDQAIDNVDLRHVPFFYGPEPEMINSEWVRSVSTFADDSLDYALVDVAPRGMFCAALAPKIKRGGLLILDNANWYMPPPPYLRPFPVGSVAAPLGSPGSPEPANEAWPRALAATKDWRQMWTSNKIGATLIWIRT